MKKIFKKSIMTMLALMMCIGFWGGNLIESDAASYGTVKVQINVKVKPGDGNYIKLSVSKDKKSTGTGGGTIRNLYKGYNKYATLNGTSWSSKNDCYVRVEYQAGTSLKPQVKYIKVTPSDFKYNRTKTVNVTLSGI